jgi:hypothetical protein
MILVVKGKDKKSRKQLKQGFKIFLYVPLSIFWWIWAKLLHSVQKRCILSSARGVQNWVTTVAPSLQCLRSKTCQALRVVSVVKINHLILLNLTAFPKQLLPIRWPAYLRFLEKLQFFWNGLIIGWPAHLKILWELHAFLRNGLNIKWQAHLKILRKLHAFLRNGFNIR